MKRRLLIPSALLLFVQLASTGCSNFDNSNPGTALENKKPRFQLGQNGAITSANSVAINSNNQIFVTGLTSGAIASCRGSAATCTGSSVSSNDLFVSQYDSAGGWIWTKQLGQAGRNTDTSPELAVSADGGVYVAASTSGNMVSCSGVSANCSGSSAGSVDYFILKYNSAGTYEWTTQLGQTSKTTRLRGIAVGSSGAIYVAGETSANLPSCSGVSATCSGSSQGSADLFISKYASNGFWVWTRQLGQTGVASEATDIALDTSENIYVSGRTSGNLVSCAGISANCTGASQGTVDEFIFKYNSSGTWQWTRQLGQTSKGTVGSTINIGVNGNVFVSGTTNGLLTSCNGVSSSCAGSSTGLQDYHVSSYTTAGTWQWTRQGGPVTALTASTVDADGNILLTGWTGGTLCPSPSSTCSGSADGSGDRLYMTSYTSGGASRWTRELDQDGSDAVTYGLTKRPSGGVLAVGYTSGSIEGADCIGTTPLCAGSASGSYDFYVMVYDSNGAIQ